jgi:Mrp family chromosome partitioning ATPase
VLLIDADLRRPALGHLLSVRDPGSEGLVDAILDPGLTLDRIAQPRPPFNLSVICGGQTPPSPYEVLKSPRFGELIEEARRQYDYIVLDTPPLTGVQDCRVIGRWVDGFLLVVAAHGHRAGSWRKR